MNKKLAAWILTVVMLAVLIAGCGGKEPAKQEQKPAAAKISIGYTTWPGYGALFVAKEKGMFQSRGLDVDLQLIEGVGDRNQALVAKKIQGMASSVDVGVIAAGGGVPLKMVWAFDSSAGADGVVAKKDKGINKISDLKGKEVALHQGSASHFFIVTMLEKNGMTDKDIKIVDMKASEAGAAFVAGKVDAAVTWEPWLTKAVAANGQMLATTKDTPGLIADTLGFHSDFVKSNPAQVQAIVEAMNEATVFMLKNPDEAAKIIGAVFKQKPEEVKADMQTLVYYDLKGNKDFIGTPDKKGPIYDVAAKAAKFYLEKKKIDKQPDLGQLIDASFLTKIK